MEGGRTQDSHKMTSNSRSKRTQSSSAADDVRYERERLFRLRADRPLHRPRDPWKITPKMMNCSGIWNWTVLILLIVAGKMFLENINKFGLQMIDPSLWGSIIFGNPDNTKKRSEYPMFILFLYVNVALMVALKTEFYLAHAAIDWFTGLSIHMANIVVLLTMPVKFISMMPEQIGVVSAILVSFMYTCLFMKLVSYIQVNKWCRDAMLDNKNIIKRRYTNNSEYCIADTNKLKLKRRFYSQLPEESKKTDIASHNVDNDDHSDKLDYDLNNNNKDYIDPNNNNIEVSTKHARNKETEYNEKEGEREKIVLNSNKCCESTENKYNIDPNNNNREMSKEHAKDRETECKEKEAVREKKGDAKRVHRSLLRVERVLQAKINKGMNEVEVNVSKNELIYPDNLTVSDIYYFWFLPTLCYELNFPRTRMIRKTFLLNRLLEVFICSNLCICIIQQYVIPSVVQTLVPFSKMEISLIAERVLKLAIPNHLMWLLCFYLGFHALLNISAEILQFADRSFFRDWWNAPNLEVFWKTWNLPVHRWAVRHVYKPMLYCGYSKITSMMVVFSLSALLHEYLFSVPLRMFNAGAFLGMLSQIPLVYVTKVIEKELGSRYGNMTVWACLIIGQPLIVMMYYHDYVIQHYGPQIESSLDPCQC